MAAVGAAGAEPAIDLPKLAVDILDIIKTAQSQNGLRHNDYARYKAYCTRRLDRIRHAKAVNFTFGRGKKFTKQELTAAKSTDPRHLQIPLMTAERAWAEYQEIKQEIEAGDSTARQRNHCIMRLKKAVRHAAELQELAGVRGTPQTALEARAYAATLRGQLAQEQQAFADALEGVAAARALYELLAASPATMRRLREQFAARAEELAPQERFCRYSLDKAAGRGASSKPSEGVMARVAAAVREAAAGAGLDANAAGSIAASAAAASAGSSDAASSAAGAAAAPVDERVSELYWKGTTLAIRNDKLSRLLTAAAQRARRLLDYETAATASDAAAAAAAAAADGATESIYLDLTAKLEEAARVSAGEASRAAKEGKVSLAVDHAAAEEAIRFAKGRFVLARNDHMIAGAVRALEAALHPAAAAAASGAAAGASGAGASGAGAGAGAAAAGEDKKDVAASSASAPAFPAPKANFFGANPWLAALTDSLTAGASADAGRGGVTSSAGGAAINPPAVRAAFAVSTWYARAVRTCDELIASAGAALGPASLAPGGSGSAPAAGGAGAGSPSSGAAGSAASSDAGAELSGDRDLVAALAARRCVYAAWRAYFVGLSHLHARRFVDATKLMHRAQTRADEALAALRLLPASLKPRDLPATALLPLVPEHAGAAPRGVVASGLSSGDREAMHALLDRVSQQTVGLQATALLHQLAARCRRDGAFAEGFARLAPTLVVQSTAAAAAAAAKAKAKAAARAAGSTPTAAAAADAGAAAGPAAALPGVLPPRNTNRPAYLAERTAPTAVAEPVTDVAAIAPALPLPVAVPFKPLLLDLAVNYFAYPDLARRVPKSELKAPAPAAAGAGAAAGGAAASPAKGGGGAAAEGAQAGGSGILGWLTGR